MEAITIALNEVFGYYSVNLNWIEDNHFDYMLFVAQNGWICEPGSLAISFRLDTNSPVVAFGHNPGAKILRRMAKEQRQRETILKATAHLDNES